MTRHAAPAALLVLLAGCGTIAARAPVPQALEAVTFTGSGYFPVELDGYGTATGPHWPLRSLPPLVAEDVPEYYRLHGAPVAYLAGSVPTAEVRARVPAHWSGGVEVSAAGGGIRLEGRGMAERGELRALVRGTAPLPRAVVGFPDWRLTWVARRDGEEATLGTSSAHLYVLLGPPRGPLLHTPLQLAAQHADGANTEAELLAGVWSAFAARDVRRARDGRPLRYYGEYLDGAPAELRRFLVSGTGQCVAWSHLLYAALAAHGMGAEVVRVLPPDGGLLLVGPWRFVEGERVIEAGANGVVETEPAGDDVAWIRAGRGRPDARLWAPDPLPTGRLGGDDTLAYMVGRNGLADTFVDTTLALPLLARGFGLEQQRAWEFDEDARVVPGGDDVIIARDGVRLLLTGANGVLETAAQPGMRRARGAGWEAVPGRGSTARPVQAALPRGWPLAERGGDDREYGWILTTGPDGISQTRGARAGMGLPHAAAIGPGEDGVLESRPGGDDGVLETGALLRGLPPSYRYISGLTAWPEPGARAQQNDWPPSEYPSHVLIRVGEAWYDPSYGRGPFASLLEWEQALLAGVARPLLREVPLPAVPGRRGYGVQRPGSAPLARASPAPPPY